MSDTIRPEFVNIPDWLKLSGMTRSNTFIAIREGRLRAVKQGRRTLVDVAKGLSYLHSLPAACGNRARVQAGAR